MKRLVPVAAAGFILSVLILLHSFCQNCFFLRSLSDISRRVEGLALEIRHRDRVPAYGRLPVPAEPPVFSRPLPRWEDLSVPPLPEPQLTNRKGKTDPRLDAGISAYRNGDPQKAVALLRPLYAGHPECTDAAGWLSTALYALSEQHRSPEEREEIFRLALTACEGRAGFPEPYSILGEFALEDGNRTRAIHYYAQALARDPENSRLCRLLGDL